MSIFGDAPPGRVIADRYRLDKTVTIRNDARPPSGMLTRISSHCGTRLRRTALRGANPLASRYASARVSRASARVSRASARVSRASARVSRASARVSWTPARVSRPASQLGVMTTFRAEFAAAFLNTS
jgi:hypothetical protein